MRRFGYARDIADRTKRAFSDAKIPEYATRNSAGADFFCAEEVVIPSIKESKKPTLVHTGIKAQMDANEVLYLYNRSSNPSKLGLVLANGVGVVDSDYFENESNDGEIMFSFINITDEPVTLKVGDKLGQGVFSKFMRPENAVVGDTERAGGFGSTNSQEDAKECTSYATYRIHGLRNIEGVFMPVNLLVNESKFPISITIAEPIKNLGIFHGWVTKQEAWLGTPKEEVVIQYIDDNGEMLSTLK